MSDVAGRTRCKRHPKYPDDYPEDGGLCPQCGERCGGQGHLGLDGYYCVEAPCTCEETRGEGAMTVSTDCLGHARFNDEAQANYVAEGHTAEFDTQFVGVAHLDHWHVIDTGVAVPDQPTDSNVICAIGGE